VKKPLLFGLNVFFEASQKVDGIDRENYSICHMTVENIAYLLRNEESCKNSLLNKCK